jgi:NAD(P)-dependent dehydrogenase (short-subunit alcohol dehydrogenase family)
MLDRAVEKGYLGRGSAVGFISSAAGLGWEANMPIVKDFLQLTDFDEATKWAQDNGKADYMFSKLAINVYVAQQAFPLLKQGIRINAILPGPTNTPLARANAEMWLGFGQDYRDETGTEPSTPEEQAYPLVFLCSDAAKGITGITMVTDAGYVASGVTESFPAATPVVGFLRGSMYGD